MKTVYLVRHGKSDKSILNLDDFDRPLNKRGLEDAPKMAKRLKKVRKIPDVIISSPAERALSTARIFAKILDYPSDAIIEDQSIYEAEKKDLLKVITHIDNTYDSAMLFGHNPAFTEMLNYLAGESIDNLPTSGVAQIEFDIDSWKEVSGHSGKLIILDFPKK